jgi:hypothetical protein
MLDLPININVKPNSKVISIEVYDASELPSAVLADLD